ncbi:hypothetical protein C8N46_11240 [Kordia periserrulae]|uniref:Uncharacterized protein n=1 Tax=Kordia periserrulae TaxID=701523 RepID=A0A2T6BRQ0_9FLAO|nr:hypothetical protein [Kordia periserrulae]PTX58732.1 hypothetical protein C8N46_11240 [Kordia periserrulae]
MKLKEKTIDITSKIAKGFVDFFALNLVLIFVVFTFQACTTEDTSEINVSDDSFSEVLDMTSYQLLNDIRLSTLNGLPSAKDARSNLVYLLKYEGQKLPNTDFTNSIYNLEDLIEARDMYGLQIKTASQLNNTIAKNGDTTVNTTTADEEPVSAHEMDEAEAIAMLTPLVAEARVYLETKGFTQDEIDLMIEEAGGTEYDLVLIVMVMKEIENLPQAPSDTVDGTGDTGTVSTTQENELTAEEIGTCALIAIGADILWALGGSNASSWSKAAIKKAFKTAAKKLLGPIGVAIAVVSFGLCLLTESQD